MTNEKLAVVGHTAAVNTPAPATAQIMRTIERRKRLMLAIEDCSDAAKKEELRAELAQHTAVLDALRGALD